MRTNIRHALLVLAAAANIAAAAATISSRGYEVALDDAQPVVAASAVEPAPTQPLQPAVEQAHQPAAVVPVADEPEPAPAKTQPEQAAPRPEQAAPQPRSEPAQPAAAPEPAPQAEVEPEPQVEAEPARQVEAEPAPRANRSPVLPAREWTYTITMSETFVIADDRLIRDASDPDGDWIGMQAVSYEGSWENVRYSYCNGHFEYRPSRPGTFVFEFAVYDEHMARSEQVNRLIITTTE